MKNEFDLFEHSIIVEAAQRYWNVLDGIGDEFKYTKMSIERKPFLEY